MDIEGPILQTLLAASRRRPPVIVFGDHAYAAILANWAAHFRRVCDAEAVVMAMDHRTGLQAEALGLRSCAFPPVTDLGDLWIQRAALFAALARSGISFIHSDADAIWLGDPTDYIATLGADLAFSPGTIWPPDVVRNWGFVVCCGLFFVRGGPVVGDFFSEVAERARAERDDQSAVNRTLAAWKARWRRPGAGSRQTVKDEVFHTFDEPVCGKARGLKLALLPERLFPRLEARSAQALVAHPLLPKSAPVKQAGLIRLGLWSETRQGDLGC